MHILTGVLSIWADALVCARARFRFLIYQNKETVDKWVRILIEWRMITTLFVHIITCMQCTHHLLNVCIHIISILSTWTWCVTVCVACDCERLNVFLPEGTLAHIVYFVHSFSRVMWICLCFVLLAACAHLLFFKIHSILFSYYQFVLYLFIYLILLGFFSLISVVCCCCCCCWRWRFYLVLFVKLDSHSIYWMYTIV